eukprot:15049584-Ditylum_brightwellii.AAC.1
MAEEASFKQGNNFDGALLWYQIINQVIPSTKTAIRNLKDELELTKMDDFKQDVRKFNTWLIDQHNEIVSPISAPSICPHNQY